MARLKMIDPAAAAGKAKELLDAVQAKLKLTPNMTRAMANSPAVLEGYLAFSGALAGGSLGVRLREQIALAVAELDGCEYCLSAHTAIGRMAGLTEAEIAASREGTSGDARTAAALRFVREVVRSQGRAGEESVNAVRSAGFSDGEIAELLANVALNLFTNYFNNVADVDVDFPRVAPRKAA